MGGHSVVGTWSLSSFLITFDDDRPAMEPFKEGHIIYTAAGTMSAVLTSPDRPSLGPGSLERAALASVDAKAAAFDSYMSYAGRYRIEAPEVVHEIQHALVPDVVGTELRRHFAFTPDGGLVLRYHRATSKGVRVDYVLTWTRVAEG